MNRRWARRAAVLLGLLLLLTGYRRKSVQVLRREGEFFVRPDGRVEVVETWEVRFRGGPFRRAFRSIPYRRLEAITDWSVAEGDRTYRAVFDGSAAEPYTFWVDDDLVESRVEWFFPETRDATRTFTLRYTLHGGLWLAAEGDRFFYTFVEADRSYPIHEAQAILHLPPGVGDRILEARAFRGGEPDDAAITFPAAGTVRFRTHDLPPGQAWEIGVAWPHGAVQAEPPAWQREEMRHVTPLIYRALVRLQPDGRVQVSETWRLRFEGDAFTAFERVLPREHLDRIHDWQLRVDGQRCAWTDEAPTAGCGLEVDADETAYRATWYFPPTLDAARIFVFSYTVRGAVAQDATDRLRLPLVDRSMTLPWPEESLEVRLELPAAVRAAAQPRLLRDGAPWPTPPRERTGGWSFHGPPPHSALGMDLTLEAAWSGDLLDLPVPQWQRAEQAEYAAFVQRLSRYALLTAPPLALLLAVVVVLLVLEPPLGPGPWPAFRPPDPRVPPALAGVLLDRRVLRRHLLATLWDLAQRGYLRLEHREASSPATAYRWRRLRRGRGPLRFYEKRVLEVLFPNDRVATCSLALARQRLSRKWDDLAAALDEEARQQGWFRGASARWAWLPKALNWGLTLWSVVFVSECLMVDAPATAQGVYSGLFLVWAGTMFVWWWLPRRLPPRTWAGWWAAARWVAYRRGLRVRGWLFGARAAELAYATAFGLGPRWLGHLQRQARRGAPPDLAWVRASAAGPSTAPAPAAGAGSRGPGLDAAAAGVFTALRTAAHEVFSALNAATAPTPYTTTTYRRASGSGARSGFRSSRSSSSSFSSGRSSGGGSSGFGA